jgi:hypothetical protein
MGEKLFSPLRTLKRDLHVDVGRVGDNLAAAAGDLEAAEEAEVDPLPDPGAGGHGHVQRRAHQHRVVAQQPHPQALLRHLYGAAPSCTENLSWS